MIRIEPRAAAALAPLIKLATEMEPTRSNALDHHVKILEAFTASLDHDFLIGRTRATEAGALDRERVDEDGLDAEPELFVDGWIVGRSPPRWLPRRQRPPERDADIRIRVAPDRFGQEHDRPEVVELNYLYLPARLQRIGAAPTLLTALESVWRRMGAREVRAHAGTEAGAAAFEKWGYRRQAEDFFGLPSFSKPIRDIDPASTAADSAVDCCQPVP